MVFGKTARRGEIGMKTKQERKDEASKEYKKIKDPAWKEYEKITDPAYEEYKKKCKEIENEN